MKNAGAFPRTLMHGKTHSYRYWAIFRWPAFTRESWRGTDCRPMVTGDRWITRRIISTFVIYDRCFYVKGLLPANRRHLSWGAYLEDKREDNQNCSVLYVFLSFVCYVSLGYFVLVSLAFVVLGLVPSVLSNEICWEERLWNDLFCVECRVGRKTLTQSISIKGWVREWK